MGKGKREIEKKEKRKMTKNEIEKKKKIITRTLIIILAIIVLATIALIANDYIILDSNKTTNLIINNRNVTSNLKNEIMIKDNMIYLSKQDIANFFDKYIYEEEETNHMIKKLQKLDLKKILLILMVQTKPYEPMQKKKMKSFIYQFQK